ncbi:MAG: type II toxin-antitoxin system HicA family toxin [Candidatus Binatia bacterium]
MGCVLIRHGGRHDRYQNTETKVSQPVPRHREIPIVWQSTLLKC